MSRIIQLTHKFILVLVAVMVSGQSDSQGVNPVDLPAMIASADRISASKAVANALQLSPLISVSNHQVQSAKSNLVGQRAPLNPTIAYSEVSNTVTSISPTQLSNYSIYYTVETSGRQRWRTDLAKAQLSGAEADASSLRLSVIQAVKNAYIDLQVANRTLEVEQEAFATSTRLSDLVESQFSLGAAPETNAVRARIALTQEEQNLIKAASEVKLARANLNMQIGALPGAQIDASEPLIYKPLEVRLDDLKKQAVELRPEIRSAEEIRKGLLATVSTQKSQYYPDVLLGANVKFDQVQIGITLPLFDFGSIRGAVGKAKEDVKAQEAQLEQVRQVVRLDVQTAYLALVRAQRLVAIFQDGILPRSESLLKRIEQGYQLGASTILDLIDAQQTYRATRNDYYAAIGDHNRSIVTLERVVGGSSTLISPLVKTTP